MTILCNPHAPLWHSCLSRIYPQIITYARVEHSFVHRLHHAVWYTIVPTTYGMYIHKAIIQRNVIMYPLVFFAWATLASAAIYMLRRINVSYALTIKNYARRMAEWRIRHFRSVRSPVNIQQSSMSLFSNGFTILAETGLSIFESENVYNGRNYFD